MSSQHAPHRAYGSDDFDAYGSDDYGYGHGDRPARARSTEQPPYFWRAPFSSYSYREAGYLLTGLPVAIAGFAFAVPLFCLGLGTFLTVIGLPVLAALLTGARGFGRLERSRARTMLALDVPAPAPVRPRRPGFWGGVGARLGDAAGWKAVLYQVLMLPWAILGFALSLTFLLLGWAMALYPLYHWVFPTFVGWPGYQVFDSTDGDGDRYRFFIESPAQIAGFSLLGLVFVFLTPQLVRGLTNVNRLAIRGLLGR